MNVFYIPALLLILFFVLWPLIEAFRISFTQWNGYSQDYKYIGLKNYLKLFKDSNFLIAFVTPSSMVLAVRCFRICWDSPMQYS